MSPLEIQAAKDGGYFVMTRGRDDYGMPSPVAFAGTLDECLSYVRSKFTAPTGDPQIEKVVAQVREIVAGKK